MPTLLEILNASENQPTLLRRLKEEATALLDNPVAPADETPANDNIVVFHRSAAAEGARTKALVCKSECGFWTLEVFVGTSASERAAELASVVLTVHETNRAPYEGCTASVFGGDTRNRKLIASGVIEDGELYEEVSLAGLDLNQYDQIWVEFEPKPADP